MQLRHAARTDAGKTRDHNEDSYGVEASGERAAAGALFVVCDGIGGYASGEVASDLAVKTIIARYYAASNREPEAALSRAFEAANELVFKEGGGKMGTTGVAAVFRDDAVALANVGDCRAYLVRNGQPRQLTRDHSFVAEQVAAGVLTEQQAKESSYRNIITRAIGHRPDVEVDVYREPLLQNDVIVLCSDGLHGQVDPEEIALAVTKVPLDDACRALIKLANERGGPDNITVVAVQVVELTFSPDDPSRPSAEPSRSVAKTARLPVDTSATLQASPVAGTISPMRVTSTPPTGDRRKGVDRRAAQPAPPPSPVAGGSAIRSFLVWIVALLLLGTILFSIYFYAVVQGGSLSASPAAAPRATLTPIGQSAPNRAISPTLVPTTNSTSTP